MTAARRPTERFDAIVVGAGPIGAHVAKGLSAQRKRVLLIEAGRASGLTWEGYRSYVENYHTAVVKEPNSPYPQNESAPSPMATDILRIQKGTPDLVGYQVERGPQGFGSTYLRSLGGTSLHWLGTTPRHLPNDFRINTLYGVGVDWPVTYDELQEYYCEAEWSIGVSANRDDQEKLGVWFPEGYDYPMERIPPSYSDQVIAEATAGLKVELAGRAYAVVVSSLAQARNSIPRKGYEPVGAVGNPEMGKRCEGNASCIPICPVQAKYSSLKTIAALDPDYVTIMTQTVVTKLTIGPNGRIDGVEYLQYDEEGGPTSPGSATATIFVVAGHAVENAKLLLASGAANSSDQVGRNLMDHPFFYTWALARESMGSFRGPGQTSGIESLRDGEFRSEFAAFRIDLGNWGWDIVNFPPNGDVTGVNPSVPGAGLANNMFGRRLRSYLGDTLPRQVRIGFDIEQLPEARNRVTISREYKDAIGCFRPVIDYSVSDYTWQAMVEAIGISRAVYQAMGIPDDQTFLKPPANLPDERNFRARDGKDHLLHFVGAGHHIGTHRMGLSRTSSVVDRNSRSWDHENLYIVGCGSLPTTATANPTLTAIATTLMSVKDMLTQLR
jgi:choline dehydrogenase-like flavoprotein